MHFYPPSSKRNYNISFTVIHPFVVVHPFMFYLGIHVCMEELTEDLRLLFLERYALGNSADSCSHTNFPQMTRALLMRHHGYRVVC